MKRLPDFFWEVLVLTSIASGSQLCVVPEKPETLPSLVCRSRSPEPFSLASLHISGIRLGDTLGKIASRYEFVGQEDGWVVFGWYDIDPENRFLRPFLAAQFDQDGKAIVLRGPGIGYEELVGWKELTDSGLIPIAGYQSMGSSAFLNSQPITCREYVWFTSRKNRRSISLVTPRLSRNSDLRARMESFAGSSTTRVYLRHRHAEGCDRSGAANLSHRLREPDRPSPMRIGFFPFPAQPVVEPDCSLSTSDFFQVVAVLVGEYQLAGFGQSNEEFPFLGVSVTARA